MAGEADGHNWNFWNEANVRVATPQNNVPNFPGCNAVEFESSSPFCEWVDGMNVGVCDRVPKSITLNTRTFSSGNRIKFQIPFCIRGSDQVKCMLWWMSVDHRNSMLRITISRKYHVAWFGFWTGSIVSISRCQMRQAFFSDVNASPTSVQSALLHCFKLNRRWMNEWIVSRIVRLNFNGIHPSIYRSICIYWQNNSINMRIAYWLIDNKWIPFHFNISVDKNQ